MFKENPLAGSLQPCLYQSRTLGYKYGRHNDKITAQWLGCKLVWVVYCRRNAFPHPSLPVQSHTQRRIHEDKHLSTSHFSVPQSLPHCVPGPLEVRRHIWTGRARWKDGSAGNELADPGLTSLVGASSHSAQFGARTELVLD